jgi:diguanylate cyclase (GGDEF)-like protein/PAS domain S-box-containing protein
MLESGAISEIALIFVTGEDFDAQVNKALALVGKRLGVSRCAVFLDSPDGTRRSNTHEWRARGVKSAMALLQDEPRPRPSAWDEALENEDVLVIEDVDSMPAELRGDLRKAGIVSAVLAPIRMGGRVLGTVNFNECTGPRTWSKSEIETLKTIAGIIASAFSKRLLVERLAASEENFRNLFHTVDDIIVIADLQTRIVFANEGAVRRLGYPPEEYLGKTVAEFLPSEEREEGERMIAAMLQKQLDHSVVDVVARDGTRIPADIRVWFGRWDGEACVYVLGKDLSAEQAALQKFEALFRTNPAAMAIVTADERRLVDVNDPFLKMLGYEREEVIGASSSDLGLFFGDARWRRAMEMLRHYGFVRPNELAVRRRDGGLVQVLFSGDIVDIQGQSLFLMVMVDVTEHVRLRRELTVERNRLANILEGTRLGTWEWNVQTGDTVFNERWAEMVGYTLAELAPTNIETWTRLVHPDDLAESERRLRDHFEGVTPFYEFEHRLRHKSGDWMWVLDRGKVIERDPVGRPFRMYGTHMDITEKKAMEEQIRDLSIRDPLTEVYNRRYLFDRVAEMVAEYSRYGRGFCISILDIDHFKAVNDTHGHRAGDYVLKEFARTVGSAIRQNDLLGRYGGEEFIVVSPNAKAADTASMIERLMYIVRRKLFLFEDRVIRLTFSCGMADSLEFSRSGFSSVAIVALADGRLYIAKDRGRDCCVGPEDDDNDRRK